MKILINSAEIRSKIFLKYAYEMTEEGRSTKINANCDAPIHEDLANAIQKLVPHLLLLTEMGKKKDVVNKIDLNEATDEELLKKFKVTSFKTFEENGETLVEISGFKILTSGRTVAFQTPKTGMLQYGRWL